MQNKQERKKLFHNRDLIETTLRDNGVDPEDPQTWHGNAAQGAIVADLSARSGVETEYCRWVIADHFGQKRADRRTPETMAAAAQVIAEALAEGRKKEEKSLKQKVAEHARQVRGRPVAVPSKPKKGS